MKWGKEYPRNYVFDGRIRYVCGDYSIMKTNSINIWTGRPMSDANQVWRICKNGIKIGHGLTLREAKAEVEKLESVNR